jgi:hypothetical protein
MKTPFFPFAARISSVLGLSVVLLMASPPVLRAVIITATLTMPDSTLVPGFNFFNANTWDHTEANPTIGTFNFSSNFGTLPSLTGLAIQLTFLGLDTNVDGGFDYNHITLTLGTPGHMLDTGIKLNGFGNSTDTALVFGSANLAGNAAAIYSALQASSGSLTVGMRDATGSPLNPFLMVGGTATLQLANQPIPFEPTQTLGFGVLAALFAFRRFPQLKRFFARA